MMKSVIFNPITAILVTVIAVLSIISMRQSLGPIADGQKSIDRLSAEQMKLEEEIAEEKQKLQAANQPFYQEKKLRDELLLQKPDEVVILIPEVTPLAIVPEPTPTPQTPWEEWKKVLF